MGKTRAAEATEYVIARRSVTNVVSIGICGALSERSRPGTLLRIASAIDGDRVLAGEDTDDLPCEGAEWATLPSARLATVDEPVYQVERRTKLASRADVVDMEGLAIATVCRRLGVRVGMLKGVSDLADDSGKADILANIDSVSAALAAVVVEGLAKPPPKSSGLAKVLRFAKVEHSVFSLPLLFAGAYLGARGWPSLSVLALIALAAVGARTLGMAMNRIFDRRLDALNPRTAGRELPSGQMSLAAAAAVAIGGLALYLLACAALGPVCLRLSPIPAVPLIAYSLLKRFTSLCHFGIGLCLALAPLGAFVAVTGDTAVTAEVLLLAAFTFFWISGFDIIYALLDVESDRATGVHSLPAALGTGRAQIIAAAGHVVAVAALIWLWQLVGGGLASGLAAAVAVGAFVAGYWPRLPVGVRFFPVSAVAGIAGALVPLLGDVG
jgi:4-hydroxybenzoate polyprenyltransferase